MVADEQIAGAIESDPGLRRQIKVKVATRYFRAPVLSTAIAIAGVCTFPW